MALSRDPRRKKKLAERGKRARPPAPRPAPALTEEFKARIAHVVHRAVCEATGTDGYRCCHYYAAVGAVLLMVITRREYVAQAGSVYLAGDPDDPKRCLSMVCEAGSYDNEFHSWIVGPVDLPRRPGRYDTPAANWIDLSARHFARFFGDNSFLRPGYPAPPAWRRPPTTCGRPRRSCPAGSSTCPTRWPRTA
jgi:hypothetical protein